MIARISFRLASWLHRRRLAKLDPAWAQIVRDEQAARKAHKALAHHQAAKRERIHTALGWRGTR